MARTNHPIYQVLVTKGDDGPYGIANQPVTSLAPGQIGFFNYDTGLSVDFTDPKTMYRIFLAVGLDKDGDGVTDDVIKSTGEYIEPNRIHHVSVQCPQACREQIVQVQPTNIKGEKEYTLSVEFHNETLAKMYGFNLPKKSFRVKSQCCETELVCSCDDHLVCNSITIELYNQINLDAEGIFSAILWDVANDLEVDIDDVQDWLDDSANEDACLALRIISSCESLTSYCQINYNYTKLRAYNMTVTFMGEDIGVSSGVITEIQTILYPEGQGYDIQQIEHEAGGWNGKPGVYRQFDLIGGPYGNYELNAEKNTEYLMLVIGHDAMSVVGFQEPINDLETIIAIPCDDIDDIFSGSGTGFGWMWQTIMEANGSNVYINATTLPGDCCTEESS